MHSFPGFVTMSSKCCRSRHKCFRHSICFDQEQFIWNPAACADCLSWIEDASKKGKDASTIREFARKIRRRNGGSNGEFLDPDSWIYLSASWLHKEILKPSREVTVKVHSAPPPTSGMSNIFWLEFHLSFTFRTLDKSALSQQKTSAHRISLPVNPWVEARRRLQLRAKLQLRIKLKLRAKLQLLPLNPESWKVSLV